MTATRELLITCPRCGGTETARASSVRVRVSHVDYFGGREMVLALDADASLAASHTCSEGAAGA